MSTTDPSAEKALREANEIIIGVVENGPWVLISDPQLRQIVGEYIADACHSIAAAAGLDEAMEHAHDAMPQRLATSLPSTQAARKAARRLVHMEREQLGSGRDGHLSGRDLAPLLHALHIDPEETP